MRLTMHRPIFTSLLLCAVFAAAQCTRESLTDATDRYLAAQTAGNLDDLAEILSGSVSYTENFQEADITTGFLATQALTIDLSRSLHDTTACATYTEQIVTDPNHPYVIGTQMRFDEEGSSISQIDLLITDEGDWLFNATGTLTYAQTETWDAIPEDQRDTREAIQAGGDAYLDLFNDNSVEVPWGEPCARLEGGVYTGQGLPTDSCNVGVPCCVDLTNRRYVIDEVLGAVDIFLNFGGPEGLPDSHEFRLEGGKLRYVHTLTVQE